MNWDKLCPPVASGWNKVKLADRVIYHSPVDGNNRAIVVYVGPASDGHLGIVIQPITGPAANREKVPLEVVTCNHTLWSIY